MLSIRTQDRMALVPYNEEVYLKECPESKKCFIRIVSVKKNTLNLPFTTLGTYKTKKRALEVLDEIEQYIIGKIIIPTSYSERVDHLTVGSNLYVEKTNYKIETLPTIYQMPKE